MLATPAMMERRAEEAYLRIRQRAVSSFLIPSLICWGIWALTAFGPDGFHPGLPWPIFVMLGTSVRALSVILNRSEVIAEQQRRIEKHERRRIEKRPG